MRGRHPRERRRVHGGVPQVGGAGHRHRRGHRRRPAAHHLARRDRRRRAAAHRRPRGPGLRASRAAPRHPGRAERQHLRGLPRPETGDGAARHSACAAWQSAPVQPRVHHRAVRPLRARQHRARRERRRRRAARRRGDRPRHRAVHRRVGPLHPARPVRRCPARAGRGVPQRRGHRRHPGRRHQLPQLRLPRGPRRDVAVLSRPSAAWPTAARRSASRSPAATSASTTRPDPRRSCRPRSSACSA